jgi:sugar O-acyltransferase (sialic acid O-acetyltransferase NeuD family)
VNRTQVILFGCGRGADTAYRYLTRDSDYAVSGFVVDKTHLTMDTYKGLPVHAFESAPEAFPPDDYEMFVFIGFQEMNGVRASRYSSAKMMGYRMASYVSSSNNFLESPPIGDNCFILGGQCIDLDVTIGDNVVMWSGNHIGDRSTIESHVWMSSHVCLSGDTRIGEGSFLGVGATVSNGVRVAERTFVGANALITRDTASNAVHIVEGTAAGPLQSDRFLRMIDID